MASSACVGFGASEFFIAGRSSTKSFVASTFFFVGRRVQARRTRSHHLCLWRRGHGRPTPLANDQLVAAWLWPLHAVSAKVRLLRPILFPEAVHEELDVAATRARVDIETFTLDEQLAELPQESPIRSFVKAFRTRCSSVVLQREQAIGLKSPSALPGARECESRPGVPDAQRERGRQTNDSGRAALRPMPG